MPLMCVYAIGRLLSRLKYVKDFKSDISTGEAVIVYDPSKILTKGIVKAIRDAGYDVVKNEVVLLTDAEEEALTIERELRKVIGVIECYVSPVTGIAKVLVNPYAISEDEVIERIRKLGFEVRKLSKGYLEALEEKERKRGRFRLVTKPVSFILGLSLVIYYSLNLIGIRPPLWGFHDIIGLVIASTVLVLNHDIVSRGFKALYLKSPVMDSLIALSAMTTYVYSVTVMAGLISGVETYFEATAGVLGFVSMGKYIESRLRARAGEAIRKLMELQRGKVKVLRSGKVVEVSVDEVNVNEVIEVRAGERILVDGIVIDGWGYVDESSFTGEPIPVFKTSKRRDPVLAGTILKSGYLRVRVTRVGSDTSLAHIIESVRHAQLSKPKFQQLADKIVGFLTCVVIALSTSTLIYWLVIERVDPGLAVMFASSVLAVTCPCPLGIAIPLVVSIAVGKVAKLGLLIRDSKVFEKVLNTNLIGFDKTGTLTLGEPMVESITIINGGDGDRVLKAICSIERRSEHVLARTILKYCMDKGIEVEEPEEFEHLPGMGVVGKWRGRAVAVGSEKMVKELGVKILGSVSKLVNELRLKGKTVTFAAIDGELKALIVISDKIRPEARDVLKFVRNVMKVRTALITGDNALTAKAVASELGIDEVYAEMRPEDKAELIKKMVQDGKRVTYVGDGINDAVVLTQSFLGIAMGSGADIAKEAGEVIITNNKLNILVNLCRLSKVVKKKVIQNLMWSFIYNVTLVPIAMGVLYKSLSIALRPEFAALAMMASDISVILNSLTILRWKH